MTDDDLVRLATRYFTALDTRDSDALADTLADSCLLIIETHNIIHDGKQAICALFESRWTVPSDRMVKAHTSRRHPFAVSVQRPHHQPVHRDLFRPRCAAPEIQCKRIFHA